MSPKKPNLSTFLKPTNTQNAQLRLRPGLAAEVHILTAAYYKMCLYVSVAKTLDLFFNTETAVDSISGINLWRGTFEYPAKPNQALNIHIREVF